MNERQEGLGGHESRSDPLAAPRVSVIVPHYNDLAGLARCLKALEAQTLRANEIIVADNNSPVGAEAVAAVVGGRASLVTVVERGAGPARNGGVAHARGDILALTDSDCIPEPGWLSAGVAALRDGDIVGGKMRVLVGDPRTMSPAEAFEVVFAFNNERYVKRKGFSVTANLFCRTSTFEAVGPFSNGLSEDVEWCQRATAKGYTLVYASQAVVGHPARRTWEDLLKKWRRINRESFMLSKRRDAGPLLFLVRALALPISIPLHVPAIFRCAGLPGLRERLGALRVLTGLRIWRAADSLRLMATRDGSTV